MDILMEENRAVVYSENQEVLAECDFETNGNSINIYHTFVSEALRGQKMAARLVSKVYEYAKEKGLKVEATCSYAQNWLEKNAK